MEWLLVSIGVILFIALGWYLHRRFGADEPQKHSNVKPLVTHDPEPLIGQGLEGKSIGY